MALFTTGTVINNPAAFAYFDSTGETVTVQYGAYLLSNIANFPAVVLGGPGAQTYDLFVDGVISGYGTGTSGVTFQGGAGSVHTVTVGTGGSITGNGSGIFAQPDNRISNIDNRGQISGKSTIFAAIDLHGDGDTTISNIGTISATGNDAIQFTGFGTHSVSNFGLIIAESSGMFAIDSLSGAAVDIVSNSGIIFGNINLGGGADQLTNFGQIRGDLFLDAGDDVVTNTNSILAGANGATGKVFLEDGFDTFNGSANTDRVDGGNDDDSLFGEGGNDFLEGGEGVDVLDGGTGNDTMTGGLNSDDYRVDSQGDTIVELAGGGFGDVVFASVTFALAADDHIEILQASNPNDTTAINLSGNALLGQVVRGNNGSNVLSGGVSVSGIADGFTDILEGFLGNDTYVLGNGSSTIDRIIDTGGIDTITSTASRSLVSPTVPPNVPAIYTGTIENLILLGTAAINGTGNSVANVITGNSAANILDGGIDALADTLIGGLDNDSYLIRSAADNITEAVGGGTADRAKAALTFTLAAGDNIEFLETVLATAGTAINLTGNEIAQTVIGNAGSNILNGKGGNDTLTGGLGNDFFLFNTALNATTNRDSITDFNVANDTIRLENTGAGLFTTLAVGTLNAAFFKANATGTATDADDRIIYETDTGKLFYDSNGSAAGGSIHFATLSNAVKPVLTNADFFII